MIIKKGFIKTLLPLFAAITIMVLVPACGSGGDGGSSSSDDSSSNSTIISETTTKSSLTIAEGETLAAPTGYSLTMTVDGVETPMNAGSYSGDIVLTVTNEISVTYGSLDSVDWRTAIYVEDGAYVADKSVAAAVVGGTVTDTSASDFSVTSIGEKFNGVVVSGDSDYTISNPVINLTGNGGNDFSGYGAAIVSKGTANVIVDNASIIDTGCIRPAVFAGGSSTMTVKDSYIKVSNGTLPSDYTTIIQPGKMMEVPWQLGLVGNCRATLVTGNGTAYYNNTHIIAQGWGCLSTDDVSSVKLYAIDCTIETLDSGYGAYSDGSSLDTFSGCTFNVADYGLIMTGGSGVFTKSDDKTTVVNSGRFGVMAHSSGSGTLTINKGTVFNTKEACIQVKTSSPTIIIDSSEMNSENGIILQAMVNDDPNMSGNSVKGPVNATFSNMTLNGDIISSMTSLANVNITFESATITGAITTATAVSAGTIDQAHYYNIGEVINTYCDPNQNHGVTVSLDGHSTWVVDKTSYLTSLTIADGASITAPDGYSLSMTADGIAKTTISTGTYTGKIVLTVTAN